MMAASSSNTPSKLLLLTALQVLVALVFLKGFLLTRVELPDVSGCQQDACSSGSGGQLPARYNKAVVLIVDAVRYDFLCGKQSADGGNQLSGSLMPKTLRLVQQAGVRVGWWVDGGSSCTVRRAASCGHPHTNSPAPHCLSVCCAP